MTWLALYIAIGLVMAVEDLAEAIVGVPVGRRIVFDPGRFSRAVLMWPARTAVGVLIIAEHFYHGGKT